MQLNYKSLGEGEPLIILHGLFGLADNWAGMGKVLSATHQLFLLDLPNHGRSPHTDQFTYEAMSAALLEFIETNQIKNPVVMGHSMGGKVAMFFACQHPGKLKKLVVVDIAPKYYRVHHRQIIDGLLAIDLPNIQNRQDADDQLAPYEPEPGVRQFLLKSLYRDEQGKFAFRYNITVIDQQIENVGQALPENFVFDKPALFIRGELSRYIKDTDLALIQTHFPKATLETIAGAGHWVHAEKPQELLAVIQNFIA
jgi:pimeloyl-ACP methyl ester carboxylesterase